MMEFINESVQKSVRQIREKAEEAVSKAVQQVANAQQTLSRHGVEKHVLEQIGNARTTVHAIVENITAVKSQIAAERQPVHEKLVEMQAEVARAQAEVNHINVQIKAKEKEIERLSKDTQVVKNVWPLGKIHIPNPQAIAQAGALRVEVAGMHGALATAQGVLARTIHSMEALHAEAVNTPIEADPRIVALYKALEAEKTAIASLTEKTVGVARRTLQDLFSADNRRKIAVKASRQIDTGLPDVVEESLFFDAIAKIEKTVIDVLPGKALELIQDAEQGISGDTKVFETRLIERVNANVDIPMLNEKQEAELFGILINLLIEAMKPDNTLDALLSKP